MPEYDGFWAFPPAQVRLDGAGRAYAPRLLRAARARVRAFAAQSGGLSSQPPQPGDPYPDRESRRPDVAIPAPGTVTPLDEDGQALVGEHFVVTPHPVALQIERHVGKSVLLARARNRFA